MRKLVKRIAYSLAPAVARQYSVWNYERKRLPPQFRDLLENLNQGDLCVDLGANVGLVTECMAKRGAVVLAFEPNKRVTKVLQGVKVRYPQTEIFEAAAGTYDGVSKLFLHPDANESSADVSQASSLLRDKPNVSESVYDEITVVDFCRFLSTKSTAEVKILKIDIEGYELELVNRMLDEGVLDRVRMVFLETHERKFKALEAGTAALKSRIRSLGLEHKFFYDWH